MVQINLALQTYVSRSRPLSAQRVVNLYAESSPQGAKSGAALFGTPGMKLFSEVGNEPIYGMHVMNNKLYVVMGNNVYFINKNGGKVLLGTIQEVDDRVQMADNGTQLMIVKPDATGWIVTDDGTITEITAAGFPGASTVTFLDQYFVVSKPNSGQFYWSSLLDGLSWDALDFATAESDPDNLVAVIGDHSQLWLFGESTTEVFYNTGNADSPFERTNNAVFERGCAAKASVVKDDDTIFWLGDDGIIYRANGYNPQRISTHGIENDITAYDKIDDAFAFSYTQEGHKFYCLTFPTEGTTFCYDVATSLWHERESFQLPRWRVNAFSYAYNKNLVGDYSTGKIYELDLDTYDENGETIQRINTFPPVFNEGKRVIFDRLRVDLDAGLGLNDGQGSDPEIMLDWSDDNGYNTSNEHWRSMGKIGDYTRRATWRRLGQSRNRIFRVTISEPIKISLTGAYADIRICKE